MRDADELTKLVRDAHRFVMYHRSAIESHPLQIYASALLFSPKDSLIRQLFHFEEPNWVALRPEMKDKWSACLQTLEDQCKMVTFSRNSRQLALVLKDGTVKVIDASNGTCLQTFDTHTSDVLSVSFSDDSTRLASASGDGMVKFWNISSGDCLSMLQFRSLTWPLVFSHDLAWLASSTLSNGKTVKIWDSISGECLSTIKDFNGGMVESLTFLHEERLLVIGYNSVIKIWDCTNSRYIQTLRWNKSTTHGVKSLTTSHNSILLASGFTCGKILVFDMNKDEAPRVLNSHTRGVYSIAFSHDSTRLASASADRTVKIWGLSDTTCLQTFDGHNSPVVSVAFSYDSTQLASVARDCTTKIWDTSGGECVQTSYNHKYMQMFYDRSRPIRAVVFSPDSTRLASSSYDHIIRIWDLNGKCLQTLHCYFGSVYMIVFSHNSVWIASASSDGTARVWDAINGRCLSVFQGHDDAITSVTFSHDSSMLASGSLDHTIKLWNVSSGKCLFTLRGHRHFVNSLAFSHGSTQLASLSNDGTVKVWNTSNGENLQTLSCHSGISTFYGSDRRIAFSHDATQLAYVPGNSTIEIWELNSSKCLHHIHIGRQLSRVSFHANDSYLSTDVGFIAIPAPSDSVRRVVSLDLLPPPHHHAGLSEDGKWITYKFVNILLLPSEYRPSCSTVSGNSIGFAIGREVFIITLSLSGISK
jgi:WD40 repeat protein